MTKLKKQVINNIAPITLAECVSMGNGTSVTVKDEIAEIKSTISDGNIVVNDVAYKIEYIKTRYPQCINFKGSFDWSTLKEDKFDLCVKGDFWINDKADRVMSMHCYLHYPNDVMYFDGKDVTPLKMKKSYNGATLNRYDVCIIGGGAGGMGCAYALKDKGYNVILIDRLDQLGGSHLNAIPSILASPINGTWFKDICRDLYNSGDIKTIQNREVGEGDTFDKLWRGGFYNWGTTSASWGTAIQPSNYKTSQIYFDDLKDKIDIRLNTEFIESYFEDEGGKSKINGIKVRDLVNGSEYNIFAEYFIDCSADAYLCRSGKTEGVDYYIGSDSKDMYNENAYPDGYLADRYKINTIEGGYRLVGDSYKPADKLRTEDKERWKDYADVTSQMNGGVINSPNEFNVFVSTTRGNAISSRIFIDKGYDYAYSLAYYRSKAHYKKIHRTGDRYAEQAKMLGLRESYRVKCDKMLTQADCEHRVTMSDIVPNHIVALSSWWVDLHNDASLQNSVNNSFLNGIPYESLIPSTFSNVLVGSRCFGASHIALASFRLIKTMMSLGYVCGHAISQCVDGWLDDVRDVDMSKLQSDVEIVELMQEMETHFPQI